MKRFEIKGFIIGVVATLMLVSTVPVFADATKKQLDAVFSGIKIVVDGYQITPKDGTGKVIEPFIVDGTTYLPVRAVAEALGKNVNWDANTQTVYLGEVKKGIVGFDTLKPYNKVESSSAEFYTDLGDKWKMRGVEVPNKSNAIAGSIGGYKSYATYGEYNLNGDYTKLTAKVGVDDRSPSNADVNITIYGDNNLLCEYTLKIGEAEDININLTGVKTLKIQYSLNDYVNTSSQGYMRPIVYDAKFYPIN